MGETTEKEGSKDKKGHSFYFIVLGTVLCTENIAVNKVDSGEVYFLVGYKSYHLWHIYSQAVF